MAVDAKTADTLCWSLLVLDGCTAIAEPAAPAALRSSLEPMGKSPWTSCHPLPSVVLSARSKLSSKVVVVALAMLTDAPATNASTAATANHRPCRPCRPPRGPS